MNEILFRAHGRKACAAFCGDLTSGSVGLPVKFEFDSAWDGLQKTAIFKGSGTTVDVVLTGDTAVVPAEVMEDSGLSLKVGVWGADPDGNVVIPTVWVEVGKIKPGAEPSGIDPHPPAPSWAAQVQQIATEALTNSEEAVATANATEARMTALEQEIAGDVEQAREYAQQAQTAAESAETDAQTAGAAAESAGSAASTASAAAATATEKASDASRDAATAQTAATTAVEAKDAAETAAASIAASAAQIEQNRQDIADLDTEVSQQKSAIEDLQDLTNRKAGMLVGSVSGAVASFTPDATIDNLLGVTVDIEPQQDLHGYDAPWPAGGGANKLDDSTPLATTNCTFADHVATEITADTRTVLFPILQALNGTTFVKNLSVQGATSPISFTKDSTFDTVLFGHSGSKQDCKVRFNISGLPDGEYKFWFAVVSSSHPFKFGYFMITSSTDTDGTFRPYSNECPISGWDSVEVEADGINLLAKPFQIRTTSGTIADAFFIKAGTYWLSFSVSNAETWRLGVRTFTADGEYAKTSDFEPSVTRFSRMAWNGNFNCFIGGSNQTVDYGTITFQKDCYIQFLVAAGGVTNSTTVSNAILNIGESSDQYEPYTGNRYTIPLGDTVYGGTLDVDAGTLTVDTVKAIADGTIAPTATTEHSAQFLRRYPEAAGYTLDATALKCNRLKPSSYSSANDNLIFFSNANIVTMRTSEEVTDWVSWLRDNPVEFSYKIANPITIQLDPVTISTISGQTNNVWADAGDVGVTFAADVKTYIDQKIAAAVAALS